MLVHPQFDPVAIQLGSLSIHWYGILYLIAFFGCLGLAKYRARSKPENSPITANQAEDLLFTIALGVVVGGRVGYTLLYNLPEFLANPLVIFKVWLGGMSFHGGLLGVLLASLLYARKLKIPFMALTDFIAPTIPFGLLCGRIGNFINGELWGHPTNVPWAMIFPQIDSLPRHPSMVYEIILEGIILWLILWWFSAKKRPIGAVSGLFLLGYGLFRSFVEFFREPDAHIGYLAGDWLTMGMALTAPMWLGGIALLVWAYKFNSQLK